MDIAGPSKTREHRLRTDDPNFAEKIRSLLSDEELVVEPDILPDLDDEDEEERPGSPRSLPNAFDADLSDREESGEEFPAAEDAISEKVQAAEYSGKDGTRWSAVEPAPAARPPVRNILKIWSLPGISNYAKNELKENPTEMEVWSQFFDDAMISEILKWTNHFMDNRRERFDQDIKHYHNNITKEELYAFIALLILEGTTKSNREDTKSLFRTDMFGRPVFHTVMPRNRFIAIKTALCFDNPEDRAERRQTDEAAPISKIFDCFVNNCQRLFVPGGACTVDEILVPFRGNCKFRVYMPYKPSQYGLRILSIVDSETSYFFNGYLYTGKGSDGKTLTGDQRKLSTPTQSLFRLAKPIFNSNRNITADNRFSSLEAVRELRKNKLTFVGTVRKNKMFIPPEFVNHKRRPLYDEMYGFSEDEVTLLSVKVKPSSVVVLISSLHHNKYTNEETKKPEIVSYYNSTKGGADNPDFECNGYSTSRKNERWPYAIFSALLNISLVNSFIVHKCFPESKMEPRNDFVRKLATSLMEGHLRERFENKHINRELRNSIKKFLNPSMALLGNINAPTIPEDRLEKRKSCSLCPYTKNRKTAYMCVKCKKPTCLECSRKLCISCIIEEGDN